MFRQNNKLSVDINNLEIVDKILSEYDFKVYKSIMNNKILFDTFKSIRFFDNCEALKIPKKNLSKMYINKDFVNYELLYVDMINDKTTFSTLYQNIITHIKDYESCDKLESHTYVCNENMVKYMKTIIKKIDDLNFLN